jgi:hypothetical protein
VAKPAPGAVGPPKTLDHEYLPKTSGQQQSLVCIQTRQKKEAHDSCQPVDICTRKCPRTEASILFPTFIDLIIQDKINQDVLQEEIYPRNRA